ncbi:MAG: 4Fe-4S dicluster domain-containing protein [Bacillota bacterium]|nr:4Fe-4S dicluster domain-containing protein [Bacillota bacterium]
MAQSAIALAGGQAREIDGGLLPRLAAASRQPLGRCYHCHKCSSGCPAVEFMDHAPNQVVRLAQYGLLDELMASGAIWTCTGCATCALRCPNGIDIGAVMDTLKSWSFNPVRAPAQTGRAHPRAAQDMRRARAAAAPAGIRRTVLFHRLFLTGVRRMGRMHELTLMGLYKVLSGDLFSDLADGLRMLARGKMPLVPKMRPERHEVAAMFERAAIVGRRRGNLHGRGNSGPGAAAGGLAR